MLVLSRKLGETIVIDGGIRITMVSIRGNQVRVGIEAPNEVGIYREELCLSMKAGESESCAGPLMPATSLHQPVSLGHSPEAGPCRGRQD